MIDLLSVIISDMTISKAPVYEETFGEMHV